MSTMHENAAAYALASLDAEEMAEFEAHLATCEYCQEEVAEFAEALADLSLLTQATPSPTLRSNVLAVTQTLPQVQLQPEAVEADRRPDTSTNGSSTTELRTRPTGPRRALPDSWAPDEPDRPVVDELKLRRQRRRSRILGGLVAALLIVSVGLGGVIYNLVQQRQAQVAQATFEQQLLRAEDARMVVAPTLQGGGRCTFIVSRKLNRALYLGTGMPDPGQGRHYQLWTATGTETDFNPELDNPVPNVRPWRQYFGGDVAEANFLAVSIEADGTTPDVPTPGQVVALAQLPS